MVKWPFFYIIICNGPKPKTTQMFINSWTDKLQYIHIVKHSMGMRTTDTHNYMDEFHKYKAEQKKHSTKEHTL